MIDTVFTIGDLALAETLLLSMPESAGVLACGLILVVSAALLRHRKAGEHAGTEDREGGLRN